VATLCRRMLGSAELALDAAQDVWEEVVRSWPSFRGESAASTWIYRIAVRKLLAARAAARREELRSLRERYRVDELPAPSRSEPETLLWAKETCDRCLQGLLFCLEPEPRLVFLFRFAAGLPYAEIARVLGRAEPAVRQMASRSRRSVLGFLRSDCAFQSGRCRCGMDVPVHRTGLVAEFARVSALLGAVEVYRAAEEILPPLDFWLGFVPEPAALAARAGNSEARSVTNPA
jgi:RNA polymerase sigma-70 factor, ECF subfamily